MERNIGKKGIAGPIVIILAIIGLLALGAKIADHYGWIGEDETPQLSTVKVETPSGEKTVSVDPEKKEALSCDGIQSVNALYNDLNFYKRGTDPNNKLEILERTKLHRRVRVADEQFFSVAVVDGHRGLSSVEAGPNLLAEGIGDVVKLPNAEDIDFPERSFYLARRGCILAGDRDREGYAQPLSMGKD